MMFTKDMKFTDEKLTLSFSTEEPAADDAALIRRIIQAYRYAAPLFRGHGVSQWDNITKSSDDVQKAMLTGNIDIVADLLRHPTKHNLLYGMDEANHEHFNAHLKSTDERKEWWARRILWKLYRLAEAIGAIAMDNTEAESNQQQPINEVIQAIERKLGFMLTFPNPYPGEFGLKTLRGIIDHRTVIAIYQAWRLSTLVKKDARVLEIGAGPGRTAFYAHKLGLTNYTIVDLPHANIGQANWLGRVLDPSLLTLAGETDNVSSDHVRIFDPSWFTQSDSYESFDIVLNGDSLTEMDPGVATDYFINIAHRAPILLSINHEVNPFMVRDLPERAGVKPTFYTRYPCWVREGYVEELFCFRGKEWPKSI